MIPLTHYLILSGVLFAIGLMGVIVRRDIIVIFMCLEMMLSAANLSLVAFSRAQGTMGLPNYDGQALSIFILTIAAAEVAIGLALIVSLYRARRTASTQDLNTVSYTHLDVYKRQKPPRRMWICSLKWPTRLKEKRSAPLVKPPPGPPRPWSPNSRRNS